MLEGDAYEQIQAGCSADAMRAGVNMADRDALYRFFINRVRAKLHLCICMSPVGDGFRCKFQFLSTYIRNRA